MPRFLLGLALLALGLFCVGQSEALTPQQRVVLFGRCNPAALFWIGGTGNWSNSANWSATSGGGAQNCIPNTKTAVTFDSNSGTSSTVTIDVSAKAASITINKSDLTLKDNVGMTTSGVVTLTTGTLNTNAKTETWGSFSSSNSNSRTATLTNSTINLTGSGTAWNTGTTTSLTITLTGSTINLTGVSQTFSGSTLTYPAVNFNGGGTMTISNGTTFTALAVNGVSKTDTLLIGTNIVATTLTLAGAAQNVRLFVRSNSSSFANRTITSTTKTLTNVDFSNISMSASSSGTSIGDAGGNINITATPAVSRFWVGNGGNWSDATDHWASSSGGSPGASMPLPQDTANVDANAITSAGQTIVLDEPRYSAINFTGVLNSPAVDLTKLGNASIYGSLTFVAGMTTIGSDSVNLAWQNHSGTAILTSAGVVIGAPLQMNGPGGTLQLADNLHIASPIIGGFALTAGTFTANNNNVTLNDAFAATGNVTRVLNMGSGTWTLGGLSGFLWEIVNTGLTINPSTSTILFQSHAAATGSRGFSGAGFTYNNFQWNDTFGTTFPVTMTGPNTFNDFNVASSSAPTLTLTHGTTITATTLELNGASGNLLTVNSDSAGNAATLSVASGTVNASFLSLQDNTATGGATFNATHSVSVSNVTGWTVTP